MSKSAIKLAVVAARWNGLVVDSLLQGVSETVKEIEGVEVDTIRVPGCWELPIVIDDALRHGGYDGALALGCILKGETMHAQLLATDVSRKLMDIQVELGKPIGWAVLTPDNLDQALERAEVDRGNKGREALMAVVETLEALRN